jgi:hypothetical protein
MNEVIAKRLGLRDENTCVKRAHGPATSAKGSLLRQALVGSGQSLR